METPNVLRSVHKPSEARTLVKEMKLKGYNVVGTPNDPKKHICPECRIAVPLRAKKNARPDALYKATKCALVFVKDGFHNIAVCYACGHWYNVSNEHHWSKGFDARLIPADLGGVVNTTPTPTLPVIDGTAGPSVPTPTDEPAICKRCKKNPIPEGRTAYCYECVHPPKAQTQPAY